LKTKKSIRTLGGEIWAEASQRQRAGTPPFDDTGEPWELLNAFVDVTMGVLARHDGAQLENDRDLPVTPLRGHKVPDLGARDATGVPSSTRAGDVHRRVEFGLDQFDAGRTVALPLRDALSVYKLLGELVSFFHQPMHWTTPADVSEYMGTTSHGALALIWEAYNHRLRDVFPQDVAQALETGDLEPPRSAG